MISVGFAASPARRVTARDHSSAKRPITRHMTAKPHRRTDCPATPSVLPRSTRAESTAVIATKLAARIAFTSSRIWRRTRQLYRPRLYSKPSANAPNAADQRRDPLVEPTRREISSAQITAATSMRPSTASGVHPHERGDLAVSRSAPRPSENTGVRAVIASAPSANSAPRVAAGWA